MASLKRKAGAELAAAADPKKAKQGQQSSLMSFFNNPQGAPAAPSKTASSGPKPASSSASSIPFQSQTKFDKAKWVAKLTKEQQQLLKLEIDTLHESWLAVLKDELVTPSFLDLKRFLSREHMAGKKIFPPPADVYSWSRYTPFKEVKVVIVGQDPYHNDGQAHGLAFSVKPPVRPPPSLKNIYIALQKDYPGTFQPPPPQQGGLLTPWAERGVLMLNTCLTVRAHEANSHSNHGWEKFTQRIIDLVAQRSTRGVVFMAWGSPAAKRVVKIDEKRHLVLRSVHPSPLSAHRGFFECGHFRAANAWLMKRHGAAGEIDWSLQRGSSTIEGLPETKAAPVAKKEQEAQDDEDDANKTDVEEEAKEAAAPSTAGAKTDTKSTSKLTVVAEEEKENAKVEATDEKIASGTADAADGVKAA
ncbi:uracil DNA glycosylase [Sporothrix curviconia]|uniref:Uracil-DNA glycosylase n=1 Tax=Sporothrix curviconia TaxID=1260050 RepID=A0ABP0BM70_9PEZI